MVDGSLRVQGGGLGLAVTPKGVAARWHDCTLCGLLVVMGMVWRFAVDYRTHGYLEWSKILRSPLTWVAFAAVGVMLGLSIQIFVAYVRSFLRQKR